MAPEQAAGVVADERSDIHALGAILGDMLAGDGGAPKPLRAIASRAAAALPEDRYQSVPSLAEDVARFRDGRPVEAYRENIFERGQRLAVRYRLPIALVLAYVFMRALLLLLPGD
jgi:hypothetical protein